MRKIIGICGFAGVGKDTVANILVKSYGFEKISFADRVKDTTAIMFDWPRAMLEGDTKESREWRNQPDQYWSNELNKEITPRLALQMLGTDCMRNGFDNDIWVLIVKKHILENPDTNFVISDIRFYNERDMIRENNGKIWQITQGPTPTWINEAISDNRHGTNLMTEYPEIHESEWRWIDYNNEFDKIIKNESTLVALRSTVCALIKE